MECLLCDGEMVLVEGEEAAYYECGKCKVIGFGGIDPEEICEWLEYVEGWE